MPTFDFVRDESSQQRAMLGRVLRSVAFAVALIIAGLGMTVIAIQLSALPVALATLGPWSRTVVFLALGACFGAVLGGTVRLIWIIAKLKRNRPIRRQLDERATLRAQLQERDEWAREYLRIYIDGKNAEQMAYLRTWGISDETLRSMHRCRDGLKDDNHRLDYTSWIQKFDDYLKPIDEAATNIIRRYAILTGVKTSVSPYKLLDAAVVMFMGTSMLGSLCKAYQLRVGAIDTLYLLGLVMGQVYLSSEIEEHSPEIEKWLAESSLADLIGAASFDGVATSIASKIAARSGQGVANGLMMYRIGRKACRMLRPLEA